MANEYSKVFTNPYPSGWENLPSLKTPIIAQALQQHTNAIVAIENFLAAHPIPSRTSELENNSIPTKVSDLINDLGYARLSQVPTKTSQLRNDYGYITENQVPNDLSNFNNDVGFVKATSEDLINYYLKSETYSKNEINQLLERKGDFRVEVVSELPTLNISETTIYCVPKSTDNTDLGSNSVLNLEQGLVNNTDPNFSVGTQVTSESEGGNPFA